MITTPCPTCGAQTRAVTGGEGTSYYVTDPGVWSAEFPGLSEPDARLVRMALLRLQCPVAGSDPFRHYPAGLLMRDLRVSEETVVWVLRHLRRAGWIDE